MGKAGKAERNVTRVGLVDLGTNSIRYDIYEIRSGRIRNLHRSKEMIRLGQNLFATGKLDPEAVDRLLRTVVAYRELGETYGVERIEAYATSALREAKDSKQIRELVRKRTGISLKVISGEEEARLIARGILVNEKKCRGRFALIDIGGGSTEINVCEDRRVLESVSLDLGVARMQQTFLKTIPPKSIRALLRHVERLGEQLHARSGEFHVEKAIGSSGTIKALARILRKTRGEASIRLRSLQSLIEEMKGMKPAQLREVPGMSERRVDTILAGAVILEGCMRVLGAKKVVFTPYALRDGILEDLLRSPALASVS